MKLFDFLRNHNQAIELLIEGTNPYAGQALSHADVDTIRQQLGHDERIRTLAQGRCVGEGRTLWVVTSQALLVLHMHSTPIARRIALNATAEVKSQKGKYGHTLRIAIGGQRASLFGVARTPAVLTHRALAPQGAAATGTPLPEAEVAHALRTLLDLQLRAQPLLVQAETEAQQLLRQAAERARTEGLLHPAEATLA